MKKFDEWLKNKDTDLYNEIAPLLLGIGRAVATGARALAPAAKTVAKDMAIGKASEKLGGLMGGDKMKKQKKSKKKLKK